ncbi:formate dehydrogenase subunit gamma [Bordetella trematum]|uniref:Formate dehydrogenase, cytochrome b556 n=1 Tax=Bordetella trematum TaxID=123899 RepID=A0A157SBU1_9BORD|nr:formate dehydrogenase subunit gamma [Bordetella trematum]AUL48734.1 formate dehydrogenase subunit gamma [Bordetella trematum]AZR95673.1 formate dehydrogenase subunit gamma [Bordetella trematum]NNH18905.1 formate dehydrogenase subunit gamma [Bordetella trematum]QIM70648.1 formate dehydrogenase subunit gamma [Bordetella trematum]CZZ92098.1 formate dehydrogenase%2C cytochrome b556 [Bordetella trematum]
MADPHRPKLIQRYTAGERSNHWVIAITFVLLALSGLALFHPAFSWLYALLGGGPWTRILHPFIGVVMFLCFVVFAARMWRHNRMSQADVQWLRQFGDVVNNREEKLPEVGRYNGGQKLLFYVLVISMVGLILSGLIMWREYFSMYFPVDVLRAASVLHATFALIMICAIIVHIYAAIWVKGSFRAMLRGTVTWGWAWKHHRAWFRSEVKPSSEGK